MMKWLTVMLEKPWQAQGVIAVHAHTCIHDQQLKRNKTALYFLLAVIGVMFFLFVITLLQRSQSFDFQALAGEVWRPLTDTRMLWQNTLALVLASAALMVARFKAKAGNVEVAMTFFCFSALCSVLFIWGQLNIWRQLIEAGYHLTSNPANSYFYLLTGIHGLHIAVGVIVMFRVFWHFYRPATPQSLSNFIELCATYWHFMLLVWLGLFALLTSDSETFSTVAAWCGF